MPRKTSLKQRRSPIPTIIGAGITEQWYFTHLKALRDYRGKIRPRFFGTETAAGLDKKIEEVLRDEGIAICVYDADVSTWNEAERKKLAALQKKYEGNASVSLCDSMPSIEYWFLLHYENTNRYFKDSAATENELCKHIPEYEKKVRFLQELKWVSDLCSDGKFELAKNRAKFFGEDGESYTNVYKAFELLEKLKQLEQ